VLSATGRCIDTSPPIGILSNARVERKDASWISENVKCPGTAKNLKAGVRESARERQSEIGEEEPEIFDATREVVVCRIEDLRVRIQEENYPSAVSERQT
jgi:hypothetical protein